MKLEKVTGQEVAAALNISIATFNRKSKKEKLLLKIGLAKYQDWNKSKSTNQG